MKSNVKHIAAAVGGIGARSWPDDSGGRTTPSFAERRRGAVFLQSLERVGIAVETKYGVAWSGARACLLMAYVLPLLLPAQPAPAAVDTLEGVWNAVRLKNFSQAMEMLQRIAGKGLSQAEHLFWVFASEPASLVRRNPGAARRSGSERKRPRRVTCAGAVFQPGDAAGFG